MLGYILHRIKLKNLILLTCTLSICLYCVQFILSSYMNHPRSSYPIILWWTPFMAEDEKIISCSHQYNCLLSKDRNYINNTNLQAVLFYGSKFELFDLPIPKKHAWAVFHEESPRNVAVFLYNRTYELFHITATFSRYSDFPLTLEYVHNLGNITDTLYVVHVEEKNKLLSNIAPVLYIQSDCETPHERDSYVRELMNYIEVDSYGACLNNKKFPREIAEVYPLDLYNVKLLEFIAKYKFVIAFENAICEDYITEKLWRPLFVGSVPIYLGSPSVEDWLPNKQSAILAKNFASPKILAEYIKAINADDSQYKKFLEHKDGRVENTFLKAALDKGPYGITTDQDNPISAFECFVCQQIHEGIIKHSSNFVYNCLEPNKGSGWEYYWQSGDCQSKALINSVQNNFKLEADPC